MRCRLLVSLVSVLGLTTPALAHAAPVWVGDFETGDLSQFGFVLNETVGEASYVTLMGREVAEGNTAARIELHNDALWGNGLKRVELQHRPDDARTAPGASTFFAWSIFLPEALPADPSAQIGYWESTQSFSQMMAFNAVGEDLQFFTRRPDNVLQWQGEGALSPGEWHRIAMSVRWSTNAAEGSVSVWFDGAQVVTDAAAQTLADGNPHFVQFGLLRGPIEFDDVPVILVDHALEGDSLDDVEYDVLPTPGGGESTGPAEPTTSTGDDPTEPTDSTNPTDSATTGPDPSGDPTDSTSGPSGSTSSSTTSPRGGAAGGVGTDADATGSADGDGGCRTAGRSEDVTGPLGGLSLLLLGGIARRRRA